MLIDTSVIVAIYNQEGDFVRFQTAIAKAPERWLSAVSYVEFVMVTKQQDWLDKFLKAADIELIPVSTRDAEYAVQGFFKYGKGRKSQAQLNFGDCLVYGTAKANRVNLLYVGRDFSYTDLTNVFPHHEKTR